MPKRNIPSFIYKLMIIAATLIWGFAFVVMKDSVEIIPPSWLLGFRFIISAVALAPFILPKAKDAFSRDTILKGAILGLLMFVAYWFQTVGLVYTTAGKNAFLTAIYCVLVPFMFWAVARRQPTKYNVIAAFICIAGVGFVSLGGADNTSVSLALNLGDGLTIVCGFFFAAHIVAAAIFAKKHDILVLTVYQFLFSGIAAFAVAVITEQTPEISTLISQQFIINILYLALLSTCVAMTFQNVALAHVPPAQTSILMSLESVFGVIFSVLVFHEQMTFALVFGFALIFIAIILSEAFPLKKQPSTIEAGKPNDTQKKDDENE